jgi:hypothetical protein
VFVVRGCIKFWGELEENDCSFMVFSFIVSKLYLGLHAIERMRKDVIELGQRAQFVDTPTQYMCDVAYVVCCMKAWL